MKKLKIILTILLIISLALGISGLVLNLTKKQVEPEYEVTYKYYINGEESKNIPEEDEGYEFDHYKCSNGVTGKWSEKKWEFKAEETANSNCRLYFVDREYEIELIAPDGVTISGDYKVKTKKNERVEFLIAPKEGITVKEVTCTNDQLAKYEEDKVILEEVNDDAICTIVTEDAKYTVEVTAVGGKVTGAKQEAKFGQNVIFNVTPNGNQILDQVTCTNNQKASWSNGKLSVTKLTNSTKCTVSFKTNQVTVTVNAKNATVSTKTKTITAGGTVSFSVVPEAGSALKSNSCKANGKWNNNSFTITNVTKNTVCNLEFTTPDVEEIETE